MITSPAGAATTVTGSCTDGGGIVWRTKVNWGNTYLNSAGTTMILIDFAGWTTNRRATATDTIVRSYGPDGRVLQTLTRTATFDYRNPLNPPSSPGKSLITIAVGRQSELAAHLVGSRKTAASLSLLAGHDHEYQAHPKKGATGPVSSTGVAEIVVGTGGRSVNPKTWPNDNPPLAFGSDTFGWLRITLHSTSADLRFVPVVGSFTDSRTITCKP